jgi:hypothetical protein
VVIVGLLAFLIQLQESIGDRERVRIDVGEVRAGSKESLDSAERAYRPR